ncbi:hypothetical protein Tsubulata_015645 [Turnera subulata]|uniref:Uncharacterized protein n=1 Tax=Turnera subulata TaxID=218843 RepID=A0A9Q0J0W9_9ROSI|nr:hypothetical protein Tsubulata_015645 [Turnera subulata]
MFVKMINFGLYFVIPGLQGGGRRKQSLILGVNKNAKRKGRRGWFTKNKKSKALYNHYANGSGWWDDEMEGVDTEEVGMGDVWEGVGTTTFGVIDWH